MSANDLLLILLGAFVGGTVATFATWSHARKVEDMVRGGLRAWDNYNRANAQAPNRESVRQFPEARS